ncbi:MAG: hypothetical protein ACTJFR_02690 [Canibacter sp.]
MPTEYAIATNHPLSYERIGMALQAIEFHGSLVSIREQEMFMVVDAAQQHVCTLFRTRPLSVTSVPGYSGSIDGQRLWADITVPLGRTEQSLPVVRNLAQALDANFLERSDS